MTLNDSTISFRKEQCNVCPSNQNDICLTYKNLHPDRDCKISYGITMAKASCPEKKWDLTLVYLHKKQFHNELRISIRSAEANIPFSNILVIGHIPPWYTGPSLACPPGMMNHDTYTIKQLKAAVDSDQVSDTFIAVESDVRFNKKQSLEQLRVAKFKRSHTTIPSILKATERIIDGPVFNYSTPVVYQKDNLRELLKAPSPYLIHSAYQHLYATTKQLESPSPPGKFPTPSRFEH